MSEDWLKNWYKDSFSKSSVGKVKDETWEKINTQLEDWTGFWYKSNSEELDLKPKASTWESISANIPQPVHIQVQENRNVLSLWLRIASIAVIFIAIPHFLNDAGFLSNTNSYLEKTPSNALAKNQTIQTPSNTVAVNSINHFNTSIPVVKNQLLALNSSSKTKPVAKSETNTVKSEFKSNQYFGQLPIRNPIVLSTPQNVLQSKEEQLKSKWAIGFNGNLNHSQFINAVTAQGLSKSSNITNIVQSNISYTISAYRHVKNKRMFKLSATLNDTKSQSYKDFVGSKYIEKTIKLNYQTISLSYVQPLFEKVLNTQIDLEWSSGLFASVRTGINETWDKESRFVMTEGFKKHDIGLSFGLDAVYKLNSNFDVSVGGFYNNGIINIFNGIENIPANFLKTYTASFGATAGLRYNL